jgi:hypothetical protein
MSVGWVSRLRRFVADDGCDERCDICAASIDATHRHLIELSTRRILCACESCGRSAAESARLRAIVPTTIALDDFALPDSLWDALQIPIGLAFLLESGEDRRPLAVYPSPAGGVESAIDEEVWSALQAANPALFGITPDVEALLIHRTGAARQYYRVSIDRCYALTGLVRARWEGLSGGAALRREIERFFAALNDSPNQGTFVHG